LASLRGGSRNAGAKTENERQTTPVYGLYIGFCPAKISF
jgi:hypothetical protein